MGQSVPDLERTRCIAIAEFDNLETNTILVGAVPFLDSIPQTELLPRLREFVNRETIIIDSFPQFLRDEACDEQFGVADIEVFPFLLSSSPFFLNIKISIYYLRTMKKNNSQRYC